MCKVFANECNANDYTREYLKIYCLTFTFYTFELINARHYCTALRHVFTCHVICLRTVAYGLTGAEWRQKETLTQNTAYFLVYFNVRCFDLILYLIPYFYIKNKRSAFAGPSSEQLHLPTLIVISTQEKWMFLKEIQYFKHNFPQLPIQ